MMKFLLGSLFALMGMLPFQALAVGQTEVESSSIHCDAGDKHKDVSSDVSSKDSKSKTSDIFKSDAS